MVCIYIFIYNIAINNACILILNISYMKVYIITLFYIKIINEFIPYKYVYNILRSYKL